MPVNHSISLLRRILGAISIVMVSALPVAGHAQNVYAGLSVGQFEDAVIDDSDTAFKIFGGFQLNDNFALEVSYADLGTVKQGGAEFDQTTFAAAAVGILPISPQFAVFGKLGINSWDIDAKVCVSGTCVTGSDSGTDPMYGAGLRFGLMQGVNLRLEYETYEEDIGDLVSAGVSYNF